MSALSALEYARLHGLAIDHTADDLLFHIPHSIFDLGKFDSGLPDPDFSLIASEPTEPKLQLSYHGGALLAESIRVPHAVINWNHFLPERHRVKKLKFEEPLLAGDHETDVRRFKREASSYKDVDQLLETCSPSIAATDQCLEDEWDEIETGEAVRSVERELDDERCHTTKEALVHLSETLRTKLTDEMKAEILQGYLPAVKRPRARSLTPLLMPAEESPEPYVPSTSELEFPLRSDGFIDSDDLLLQIGREMEERDQILSDEVPGINLAETRKVLQAALTMVEVDIDDDSRMETIVPPYGEQHRARMELKSLKVDVPMMSSSSIFDMTSDDTRASSKAEPTGSSPSKPEQVYLARIAGGIDRSASPNREHHVQTQADSPFSPSQSVALDEFLQAEIINPEDEEFDDTFDDYFSEEIFKFADGAKAEVDAVIEQDQFIVPEENLKHSVPQLEKLLICPPWDVQDDEYLMRKLDEMCLVPSNSSDLQKERQMNWEAFPSYLMNLGIDDKIEDGGQLHKWIEPPHAINKSEQMLFKRPGLRLLDAEDDSDDELEEDFELAQELSKPVSPTAAIKRTGHDLDSALEIAVKRPRVAGDDDMHDILGAKHSLVNSLQDISTSSALETFLDLRGGRFKRIAAPRPPFADELMEDPIQPTQSEQSIEDDTCWISGARPLHVGANSNATVVQVPSTPDQDICQVVEKETPRLMEMDWSRTVVVETAILQKHRSFINFLEVSGRDQVNIVYREMNKIGHDVNTHASPDMILSPTASLIFTNLQALNQKSLPGQGAAGQNMVQSRVLQLAQDYDRFFVVITTPSSAGMLAQAQVDTMTAFAGFCASLFRNGALVAVPVWVTSQPDPLAIDEAFQRSVWNLICRYGFPDVDPSLSPRQDIHTVALINEETLWEQFLRRMGLNPMAAQIVIEALKRLDPPGGSANPDQSWGLRRFVQMHRDERSEMFVDILGSKVLDRINGTIEQRWG